MTSPAASEPLRWRVRAVSAAFAVALLGLFAGCAGSQPPASGVPRPSPGGTSASPAPTPHASTMTTPAPGPTSAMPEPVFQASTSALTAAMRSRMTGVSWH